MPKLDPFVKKYTKYLELKAAPSHARLEEWLKELQSEDVWRQQAALIYSPERDYPEDSERRSRPDPDRHPIPSPIHQARVRLKFVDSALRKLGKEKKYGGFTAKGIAALEDVLAARIVVYFPHQLTWIDSILRTSDALELHPNILPKSFHDASTLRRLGLDSTLFDARDRKVSGYSSLHYVARFKESALPTAQARIWFEVQVRTVAEELWGEIEHHIGYKAEQRTAFSVQRQFRVIRRTPASSRYALGLHL